jgi:hypothetical protein
MLRRRRPQRQTARARTADRSEVALIRKPFAEFAADIAVKVAAGCDMDDPIAETAQLGVVEVAPGDWRLRLVLDHAVAVVCDESWSTREEAVEEIVDRLGGCIDPDQIGRVQ